MKIEPINVRVIPRKTTGWDIFWAIIVAGFVLAAVWVLGVK